jgi:hypothetical protein
MRNWTPGWMLNSSLSWQPKRVQAEDACLQQQMMIVADGW